MSKVGLWAILAVVAMVLVGGVIGFVWLPRVVYSDQGFFAAWCSAFGVPRSWAAFGERPVARISSDVVLTHELLGHPQPADVGHGATLAMRCAMCHGPTAIRYANSPNLAGLYGMPRRMAYYDYAHPAVAPDAWTVIASVIGGALLVISGLLFIYILVSSLRRERITPEPYRFSEALHESPVVPQALNGFAVWVGLMLALTLVNYGFPIWELRKIPTTAVPAVYVGGRQ